MRMMSGKLTKIEEKGEEKTKMRLQSTPVTREVLAFGIGPFLHSGQEKEETKAISAPLNKNKQMPEMGNFVQAQCVEFLSEKKTGIIQVNSVLPAFTAGENTSHWRCVVREIKAQEGFAIIGLKLPTPGKP